MQSHPNLVKLCRWTGLALTVLLVVVGLMSLRWQIGWTSSSSRTIAIGAGAAMIFEVPKDSFPDGGWAPGLVVKRYEGIVHWTPAWTHGGLERSRLIVPIWILLILVAAPTAWMWLRTGSAGRQAAPTCQPASLNVS